MERETSEEPRKCFFPLSFILLEIQSAESVIITLFTCEMHESLIYGRQLELVGVSEFGVNASLPPVFIMEVFIYIIFADGCSSAAKTFKPMPKYATYDTTAYCIKASDSKTAKE